MKNYLKGILELPLFLREIVTLHSFSFMVRVSSVFALVIIVVDFLNILSNYLVTQNSVLAIIVLVLSLIIFTSLIIELKIVSLFRIKSVNGLDAVLCMSFCSSFLYLTASMFLQLLSFYKLATLILVIVFIVITIITRGVRYSRAVEINKMYIPNVYDLKDILNGDFDFEENSTVLMNEKDVNYDLLQRNGVIDSLYSSILHSKPDGKFVISLEGKWGSGKTTIINNVKRKLIDNNKDVLVIDEFDPWGFNDQESLFNNMFDIMLKKSGYGHSEQSIKKTIRKFSETIFGGGEKWELFKGLIENNNMTTLKSDINNYLRLCDKKVVFFIDNIDRIDSKNVLILFNSVSNLLDFERITYVLSFDNERVKVIFDNELAMDYQYLKKIIQLQIRVPEIDTEVLSNIYLKCINNLLCKLGDYKNDMSSYELIVDNLCNNSLDIRDFKRFVNSVISQSYIKNTYLCRKDLILVEYTRLHNVGLYNELLRNKRFFITYDKEFDSVLMSDSIDNDKYSKESKEYFNMLFSSSEHEKYTEILSDLFPNVKQFKERSAISYRTNDSVQRNDVSRQHRICSAKYFDLYFTKTTNDFVNIGRKANALINSLNSASGFDDRLSAYDITMNSMQKSYHTEFFERLQVYINLLEENAAFELSRVLINRINSIDDLAVFMALNARRRASVIIVELMKQIDDTHFSTLIDEVVSNYINIDLISELGYWMDPDNVTSLSNPRLIMIKEHYRKMAEEIIHNRIDIYEDKYYNHKNIWALYRIYKDNSPEVIKVYIEQVMSKDNIYKIIYDLIGLSHGKNYTYSISEQNFDFLSSIEAIDAMLVIAEPKTDDQKFVLEVYNRFKSKEIGVTGRYGITVPEERIFKNL